MQLTLAMCFPLARQMSKIAGQHQITLLLAMAHAALDNRRKERIGLPGTSIKELVIGCPVLVLAAAASNQTAQ